MLILIGLGCIIGAIIGGGVKLVQVELSPVTSLWRQLLLGVFGIGLVIWGINTHQPPPSAVADPSKIVTSGERVEPPLFPTTNVGTAPMAPVQSPPNSSERAGRSTAGEPDYLVPQSGSRQLVAADLAGFSGAQLRIARNEIYARHGRRFKSADLATYFSTKNWYSPISDEVTLSPLEAANVQFIHRFETSGR
ncbi:MAG: YARHG domain-containing protein [Novosphingobium sp.]